MPCNQIFDFRCTGQREALVVRKWLRNVRIYRWRRLGMDFGSNCEGAEQFQYTI